MRNRVLGKTKPSGEPEDCRTKPEEYWAVCQSPLGLLPPRDATSNIQLKRGFRHRLQGPKACTQGQSSGPASGSGHVCRGRRAQAALHTHTEPSSFALPHCKASPPPTAPVFAGQHTKTYKPTPVLTLGGRCSQAEEAQRGKQQL